MKRKYIVFHPGTQHSWQTAMALADLERLDHYRTSIFYQPDRFPYRFERYLPGRLREKAHREFQRFRQPGLDPSFVKTVGTSEWLERIARRAGFRNLAKQLDRWGNEAFTNGLRREITVDPGRNLWGYDNAALSAFRCGRENGTLCVLDRTIGDWRAYNAIMGEVFDQYPEFFLDTNFVVSQERICRDQEEFSLSDVILTGSPFAADTVRAHVGDPDIAGRVRVLNYCFDEALFGDLPRPTERAASDPLRFLFVGQAGVRKGIHLVLKVFDQIPASAATLTIVGDLQIPSRVFARYADRVTYHRTVARADIPAMMLNADILLFPSYFEGAGIVLYEALAAGLGLIQSKNADVAATGETGLVLEDLSEDALRNAVMTAIEDRHKVQQWRAAAQEQSQRYTFARYRSAIAELIDQVDR